MKYYIIEDFECYYVESETDYSNNGHIIAECSDKDIAEFIARACAEYKKNNT